jgi:hypothetical protein
VLYGNDATILTDSNIILRVVCGKTSSKRTKADPNTHAKTKAKLHFCFLFLKTPSPTVAKLALCKTSVLQLAKLKSSSASLQN